MYCQQKPDMSKKVCICETVMSPGPLGMATSLEENECLFFTDLLCPSNGLGNSITVIYFKGLMAPEGTRRKAD